jgi:hypothetical protein
MQRRLWIFRKRDWFCTILCLLVLVIWIMQVSFGIDGNQKCTSGTGLLRRESGRDRINETAVFQEDAIKSMMLCSLPAELLYELSPTGLLVM